MPVVPGRRWRRANFVFWPRTDDGDAFVGHRGNTAADQSTDAHTAVPFSLLRRAASVPLFLKIGGLLVESLKIPQGVHPATAMAVIAAAYQRAPRFADRRLLDLPVLPRGPTTGSLLTDYTVIYADDAISLLPALHPSIDAGASMARVDLRIAKRVIAVRASA